MLGVGTLADAIVRLAVDSSALTSGFDKAQKEIDTKAKQMQQRWEKALTGIRNVSALTFTAGVGLIADFGREAAEAEGVVKRLDSTLRGMGQQFEAQSPHIQKWAETLMRVSDFDDEVIIEGLRDMAQLTGSVEEGMLGMAAATNLANQSGESLEKTSSAVLKGYQGQDRALKTMGVTLKEGVKGHAALVSVMEQVGGANERTADSTERAYRRMQVSWGNAKESLGTVFLPVITAASDLLTRMTDRISHMDDATLKATGNTALWTVGLGALLAMGSQVTLWAIQLRAALVTMAAAQTAANAATSGGAAATGNFLTLLKGVPPAAAAAVIALVALTAAYIKLNEAQNRFTDALGNTPGGGARDPNSGYVRTENGLESIQEIDRASRSSFFGNAVQHGVPQAIGLALQQNQLGKQAEERNRQLQRERDRADNAGFGYTFQRSRSYQAPASIADNIRLQINMGTGGT